MIRLNVDKFGYPDINYGDEFPALWPDGAPYFRIDLARWYYYDAATGTWVEYLARLVVKESDDDPSATGVNTIVMNATDGLTVTNDGSGQVTIGFDDTAVDHGNLTGLGDDDHTIYLKEKAQGGLASEIPTHNHSGATEAGTIAHSATTGQTTDDHHAKSHAHTGADGSGTVAHSDTTGKGTDDHHAKLHQADHQSGAADAISGNIDSNARVAIRKNTGSVVGTRRQLNFIEGTNVTMTIADDSGSEEVDITINAAGGGGDVGWADVMLLMGA